MTALATAPSILSPQQKLAAIEMELRKRFFERDDHIRALLCTVLARLNGMAFGEPGTGKSALLEAICKAILGAKYFRILMDRQMDKSEFMGMYDLPKYEQTGEWSRNITDTILDAHLALIDEADKCGPAVTTPFLTAINEHLGKPGMGPWQEIPLLTALGAANAPFEPGQEAFGDRFEVWLEFERIKQFENYLAMLESQLDPTPWPEGVVIELAELQHVIAVEVPAVKVPRAVLEAVWRLRCELEANGIFPSDRRIAKALRLLQAHAWLDGRDTVAEDDITILRHVVWTQREERQKVATIVLGYTGPVTRLAIKLMAAVAEKQAELDTMVAAKESLETRASKGGLMQKAIREMQGQIDKARAEATAKGRNTSRLDEVQSELNELHVQVYVVCMNTPEAGARRMIGA